MTSSLSPRSRWCACVHVCVCMRMWVSAYGGLAGNAGPPREAGRLGGAAGGGDQFSAPGGVLSAALQGRVCTAQTVSPGGRSSGCLPSCCVLWRPRCPGGCGQEGGAEGWGPHAPGPKPEARPPERTARHSEPWEVASERPVWFLLVRVSRGCALQSPRIRPDRMCLSMAEPARPTLPQTVIPESHAF